MVKSIDLKTLPPQNIKKQTIPKANKSKKITTKKHLDEYYAKSFLENYFK
jgi:hypothetical protein|tara:strand:- start:217 stop:366 length:150 start_codon:yes stop_codon:yes gene_type:complete